MVLLPKYGIAQAQTNEYVHRKVTHAIRRGQRTVTLRKEGMTFTQDSLAIILSVAPQAKVKGNKNQLVIELRPVQRGVTQRG